MDLSISIIQRLGSASTNFGQLQMPHLHELRIGRVRLHEDNLSRLPFGELVQWILIIPTLLDLGKLNKITNLN